MALRNWKRMRTQARAAGDAEPVAPEPNPWSEPDAGGERQQWSAARQWADAGIAPRLSDLGGRPVIDDQQQAERINEWAERMRQHRRPTATTEEPPSEPDSVSAGYWTCEHLFADSRRLEREEPRKRSNPWRVKELLEVFELPEGATAAEVGSAYRRLAKEHHPDRFMEADRDTQEFHAAHMRRIIDAYRELRQLQGV